MENWSPEKAIAILMDNKVNGYFCPPPCKGKLTPYLFKSFICTKCKNLFNWKVETQNLATDGNPSEHEI